MYSDSFIKWHLRVGKSEIEIFENNVEYLGVLKDKFYSETSSTKTDIM